MQALAQQILAEIKREVSRAKFNSSPASHCKFATLGKQPQMQRNCGLFGAMCHAVANLYCSLEILNLIAESTD